VIDSASHPATGGAVRSPACVACEPWRVGWPAGG
jgi:hypothetical protein